MIKRLIPWLFILVAVFTWAYKNEPDGFGGIKWGADFESLDGFVFSHHDPGEDVDVYLRPSDNMEYEGVRLSRIEYCFWHGEFYGVSMEFEEYDAFLGLKELFDERYEKGFRKGTADEERYIALWEGNKTELILAYHVREKAGVLWMASLKMIKKMEKWDEEQARDEM